MLVVEQLLCGVVLASVRTESQCSHWFDLVLKQNIWMSMFLSGCGWAGSNVSSACCWCLEG